MTAACLHFDIKLELYLSRDLAQYKLYIVQMLLNVVFCRAKVTQDNPKSQKKETWL